MGRLQLVPSRSPSPECLVQAHSHLRGNTGVAIQDIRQVLTADSQMNCGISYAKAERLQTVVPN